MVGLFWELRVRIRGVEIATSFAPEAAARCDALWAVTGTLGQFDGLRTFSVQGLHTITALDSGEPIRAARALILEAA
jgi:hypothetical protein